MTDRNFKEELSHSVDYDMEKGKDTDTIDHNYLIEILTEFCERIEQLEEILNER